MSHSVSKDVVLLVLLAEALNTEDYAPDIVGIFRQAIDGYSVNTRSVRTGLEDAIIRLYGLTFCLSVRQQEHFQKSRLKRFLRVGRLASSEPASIGGPAVRVDEFAVVDEELENMRAFCSCATDGTVELVKGG